MRDQRAAALKAWDKRGRRMADEVSASGGFTYDARGNEFLRPDPSRPREAQRGVVAVPGHSSIITAEAFADPEQRTRFVREYLDRNAAALAANEALHLGAWHDKEHGEVAFDLVEVHQVDRAVALGRERNEQAIWALDTSEEIGTGGTGGREAIDIVGDDQRRLRAAAAAFAARPFILGNLSLFDVDEWSALVQRNVADALGDLVVDAATGASLRASLGDDALAEVVRRQVEGVKGWGESMRRQVAATLERAVRDGASLDDVAERLAEVGPLSADAALRMARGQIAAAANAGMLESWRSSGAWFKQWVTQRDERVRDAHARTDRQIRPVELAFDVDGHAAECPGDPSLPVELRIGCRCWMRPVDADGRVRADTIGAASLADLRAVAGELGVANAERLTRRQLQVALDRWRRGFGEQRLDEMTRAQLLSRARIAGIRGRHAMSRQDLMLALAREMPGRRPAIGFDLDRWRLDHGYVVRPDLRRLQAAAGEARARLPNRGDRVGDLVRDADEGAESIRQRVAARFDADGRGPACVVCGALLGRGEPFAMAKLSAYARWSSANAAPVCATHAVAAERNGRLPLRSRTSLTLMEVFAAETATTMLGQWVSARTVRTDNLDQTLVDADARTALVTGVLVASWVEATQDWRWSVNGRSVDVTSVERLGSFST